VYMLMTLLYLQAPAMDWNKYWINAPSMVIPGTLFLIQLKASYLLEEVKIHP